MRNFADRVLDAFDSVGNPTCVGLDTRVSDIPEYIKLDAMDKRDNTVEAVGYAFLLNNKTQLDAAKGRAKVCKPNLGFYIGYGAPGLQAYIDTIEYAHYLGFITIADCKANDIGDTAVGYADGILGSVELLDGKHTTIINSDAVTVPPYIGSDCIQPFIDACKRFGKGVIILDKTSNPSSGELQDMRLADVHGGRTVYEHVAWKINMWGKELRGKTGFSSMGAVVGAPYPEQAKRCREIMENVLILIPGYGSQGGTAKDCTNSFYDDGMGGIVNNSRGISQNWLKMANGRRVYKDDDFGKACGDAIDAMNKDLMGALAEAGKLRWKSG